MNDLEQYIKQSKEFGQIAKKEVQKQSGSNFQRANGNASLLDFIKMIGLIVESTMEDLNVEFLPYERSYIILEDPNEPVNRPTITFRVKDRHHKGNRGYKPVFFDTYETPEGKSASVYTEYFETLVQFDIIANEYDLAWTIMDRFEEVLLSYAETIRGNGIVEYYFNRQFFDTYYDNYRNTMSILNIEYCVETERIRVIFNENIKDIITTGTAENIKDFNVTGTAEDDKATKN
jgi:hypothetical protein